MFALITVTDDCLDSKVVYRRYASLFFVCGIDEGDNGAMNATQLGRND